MAQINFSEAEVEVLAEKVAIGEQAQREVSKFIRFLAKQHKVDLKKHQVVQDLSGFDRIYPKEEIDQATNGGNKKEKKPVK